MELCESDKLPELPAAALTLQEHGAVAVVFVPSGKNPQNYGVIPHGDGDAGSREVNIPVCMARRADYLALLEEFKLDNHDSSAPQPQFSCDKATLTTPHMRAAAGAGTGVQATTRHTATLSSTVAATDAEEPDTLDWKVRSNEKKTEHTARLAEFYKVKIRQLVGQVSAATGTLVTFAGVVPHATSKKRAAAPPEGTANSPGKGSKRHARYDTQWTCSNCDQVLFTPGFETQKLVSQQHPTLPLFARNDSDVSTGLPASLFFE